MKIFNSLLLLCGALALSVSVLPASAQPLIKPDEAREKTQWADQLEKDRKANAGSKKVEPDSGFFFLLKACESLGENPGPVPQLNIGGMTPAQMLAFDRAYVAYYAESLKWLRLALGKGITVPIVDGKTFDTGMNGWNNYNASFRQLARVLSSESNVRLAAGDFVGALDSRLDCLDMAVSVSRGPLSSMLAGSVPAESIARKDFDKVVAKLDAPTIRAALFRLKTIDARRPSFIETLQNEKAETIEQHLKYLNDPDAKIALAQPGEAKRAGFSAADAQTLLALSPAALSLSTARFFDAVIARETLPYQRAKAVILPVAGDPLSANAREVVYLTPHLRLFYEGNRTSQLLLEAALELRAQKLETGAYPATFEAGIDPLSDEKPFVYRRAGKIYQLYSVGPNGIDDGGAPLQTLETDEKTGAKTVSERVRPDSSGDILAPRF